MSDLKISQLTDGNAAQAADEFVVARSGGNFRIDGASVAAAATSVGTLSSLTVSGDLTVDTSTLKVDSTNNRVGIGTASPATALDVRGVVSGMSTGVDGTYAAVFNATYSADTTFYGQIQASMSSVAAQSGFRFMGGGTGNVAGAGGLQKLLDLTRGQTIFYTADTERMRLDASGNLGLGVTPSAWDTAIFRTIQVGSGVGSVSLSGRTDNGKDLILGSNIYYASGALKYIGAGTATMYRMDGATHSWSSWASGSADANVSGGAGLAMTLDASGRLLQSKQTLASYKWTTWNPSDLVGTSTNAGSGGTTDDSEFVTLANSSGTLTVTFDIAGAYMVCVSVATIHANAYSFDRLTTAFGGTATRRNNRDNVSVSGDPDADSNTFSANCFYVSATAGQTLTLLPSYELTGSGTTANHEAYCNITVQYCGG